MKERVRRSALEKRKKIGRARGGLKSWLIKRRLFGLEEWKKAESIMLYISIGSEVRTKRMIKAALKQGKKVLVPKVEGKKIKPVILEDLKKLRKSEWLVPEPSDAREYPKHKIDLVVVPGVGFDFKGNRIGYGGGYYDGFLRELREILGRRNLKTEVVGLAYEKQLYDELPREAHDQKVKKIVTEKRIIECGEGK